MRTLGSRMGLLSDPVTGRLENLPEGSLRQSDLDNLLVVERIFGPLGAALNASRYVALATHRELREESDRVDAAEEALDDTVAVDDPRVAQVAAQRHAFELALDAVIEESQSDEDDDALFDSWDEKHPPTAQNPEDEPTEDPGSGQKPMRAAEAFQKCRTTSPRHACGAWNWSWNSTTGHRLPKQGLVA